MTHKILIVDDEAANLRLLERLFKRDYVVLTASSGIEALRILQQQEIAVLITDQRMSGMTGIELLQHAANIRPQMVRIILTGYTDVEALVEAINCGQIYKYVTKPWNNKELLLTVERAIEHYETSRSRHELALANERLVARAKEMTRGFVRAIADALDAKDQYIHGHARRVSGYSTAIGRRMGLGEVTIEQLSMAAFLHDIGKLGTPDQILLKPEELSREEVAIMRLHPTRGARMLSGICDMEEVAEAIRHHHENFDGSGYPSGLSGEQIPLLARIIRVADAYDAITSQRPYRQAASHEFAIEQLLLRAGEMFDQEVVNAFCDLAALAGIRRAISQGDGCIRISPRAPDVDAAGLSFGEVIHEIETEPMLAVQVLHEANIGWEESRTIRLHVACARLGQERLREMLTQAEVPDWNREIYSALWEHSIRAAEAARMLADKTGLVNPEDAYTLGLIHDAGKILLHNLFPRRMEQLSAVAADDRSDVEVALFGIDHAQVSQWLAEKSGVSHGLSIAIQAHHDAVRTNTPIALLLHIADAIAKAGTSNEVATLDSIESDRLYMLGVNRSELSELHSWTGSAVEQGLQIF